MSKSDNEKAQKDRAWLIFIILVVVLIVCIFFILAIQYHWGGWFAGRNDATYDSTDPLTWVLASLIGATLYLMGQIATFYPKINEKPDADNQNDFIRSSYWYATTLMRAPILTVVIMWLLINLSVNMGGGNTLANAADNAQDVTGTVGDGLGISVNFANFPDIVNLGIAFILGFYSRVARKQLDILAKYLFTRAWALAEMGFEVAASAPDIILLGETFAFKTEPKMDVVWTTNIGTIGAESGIYTAPEKAENYDNNVVVLAYLRSEPTSTQAKQVTLKLFRITGNSEIDPGNSATLKLEKKLEKLEDVAIDLKETTWVCNVPDVITGGDGNGVKVGESIDFTAPTEARDLIFTAKYKTYDARFTVTVNKKVNK